MDGLHKEFRQLRTDTDEQTITSNVIKEDIASMKVLSGYLENNTKLIAAGVNNLEVVTEKITAQNMHMVVALEHVHQISRKIYRRQR